MQTYINFFTSSSTVSVGMEVHKKTIALCVYSVSTGVILDERELPHDVPKVTKYLQKVQGHHGSVQSCYEASSARYQSVCN